MLSYPKLCSEQLSPANKELIAVFALNMEQLEKATAASFFSGPSPSLCEGLVRKLLCVSDNFQINILEEQQLKQCISIGDQGRRKNMIMIFMKLEA